MARQLRLMFLLFLLHKPPPVANDSAFALRASECKTVSGGSASWRLMIWLRPLNLPGYSGWYYTAICKDAGGGSRTHSLLKLTVRLSLPSSASSCTKHNNPSCEFTSTWYSGQRNMSSKGYNMNYRRPHSPVLHAVDSVYNLPNFASCELKPTKSFSKACSSVIWLAVFCPSFIRHLILALARYCMVSLHQVAAAPVALACSTWDAPRRPGVTPVIR